jgi:hypothetical protein
VQQIGNASGVAVIGASYFGLAQSYDGRIAVVICLGLLIGALSLLALLLHERPSLPLVRRGPGT